MSIEPVLAVLLLGSMAALFGGLGVLPFLFRERPSQGLLGSASAVASGLMLGTGYLLLIRGLDLATVLVLVGAGLGVLYTWWLQSYAHLGDLESTAPEAQGPEFGYKLLLQSNLHAAAEGIAIGVAAVLELRLGLFLAVALAVHNVAEAMALTDALRGRGATLGQAAALGVVSNVPQPLLALAAFALSPVLEGLLPLALGFSAGTFVFLVLTELLPTSYERADNEAVSLLVGLAAGSVVLLEHYLVQLSG
jgi:ZIP family zinc transporter